MRKNWGATINANPSLEVEFGTQFTDYTSSNEMSMGCCAKH